MASEKVEINVTKLETEELIFLVLKVAAANK
jgi:hypothetical protein